MSVDVVTGEARCTEGNPPGTLRTAPEVARVYSREQAHRTEKEDPVDTEACGMSVCRCSHLSPMSLAEIS